MAAKETGIQLQAEAMEKQNVTFGDLTFSSIFLMVICTCAIPFLCTFAVVLLKNFFASFIHSDGRRSNGKSIIRCISLLLFVNFSCGCLILFFPRSFIGMMITTFDELIPAQPSTLHDLILCLTRCMGWFLVCMPLLMAKARDDKITLIRIHYMTLVLPASFVWTHFYMPVRMLPWSLLTVCSVVPHVWAMALLLKDALHYKQILYMVSIYAILMSAFPGLHLVCSVMPYVWAMALLLNDELHYKQILYMVSIYSILMLAFGGFDRYF